MGRRLAPAAAVVLLVVATAVSALAGAGGRSIDVEAAPETTPVDPATGIGNLDTAAAAGALPSVS